MVFLPSSIIILVNTHVVGFFRPGGMSPENRICLKTISYRTVSWAASCKFCRFCQPGEQLPSCRHIAHISIRLNDFGPFCTKTSPTIAIIKVKSYSPTQSSLSCAKPSLENGKNSATRCQTTSASLHMRIFGFWSERGINKFYFQDTCRRGGKSQLREQLPVIRNINI